VFPLLGVICIVEVEVEAEEANVMRTALSDVGASVTDSANASEQNAKARKTLGRLEVKVEKPERTVFRRRNISASCETELPGLIGRSWFSKTEIGSNCSEVLFSVVTIVMVG